MRPTHPSYRLTSSPSLLATVSTPETHTLAPHTTPPRSHFKPHFVAGCLSKAPCCGHPPKTHALAPPHPSLSPPRPHLEPQFAAGCLSKPPCCCQGVYKVRLAVEGGVVRPEGRGAHTALGQTRNACVYEGKGGGWVQGFEGGLWYHQCD